MSEGVEARTAAVVKWWRDVSDDAGASSRLRRASRIEDVMMEAATAELHAAVGARDVAYGRTALVAGALSHVRRGRNVPTPFATALGSPRPNQTGSGDASGAPRRGKPLMGAERATRLRKARTPEEALGLFRAAVALLGASANVGDLARYLMGWCDDGDGGGETPATRQRTRFALAYHRAAIDAAKES